MSDTPRGHLVAVYCGEPAYSATRPFDPGEAYPEAPSPGKDSNHAYAAVRGALYLLGLDEARFGTPAWNPLRELVRPGDTVVLKPNLIRESHLLHREQWEHVITHGAVVRAVLDYVGIALAGRGRVVIADGPQTDSDFDEIVRRTGLHDVAEVWRRRGLAVDVLDLRRDRWFQLGDVTYKRVSLPGDPSGYTTVELGGDSEFASYALSGTFYRLSGRFYGADYDAAETATFHNRERHAYILCRTVMDADVVINLPKLKTHKKTGVTISLKNIVGINGYRNCLPHVTTGTPAQGGDEFPTSDLRRRVESGSIAAFKRVLAAVGGGGVWARALKNAGRMIFGDTHSVIRSGNWYGNDTTWRMALDLNKCLFYFDGTGARRREAQRYFTLVDGILAGEGNGPQAPDAVRAGLIVAGWNPLSVDTVCAALMGFDYRRIPILSGGWGVSTLPLASFGPDAIRCRSNRDDWTGTLADLEAAPSLSFKPHFGWKGWIERRASAVPAER